MRESPEALGFGGENHWLFEDFDHDDTAGQTTALLEGYARAGFLSFPSMKDPSAARTTAEIVTFIEPEALARWAGTRWMRRGADYEALKARMGQALLDLAERNFPGFGALVDYWEVSTPLTVESFTGYHSGGFAELAVTPERLRRRLSRVRTPIAGLYLTGADVCSLGILGAAMGAVFSAGAVLGPAGIPQIMRAARHPATA